MAEAQTPTATRAHGSPGTYLRHKLFVPKASGRTRMLLFRTPAASGTGELLKRRLPVEEGHRHGAEESATPVDR